MFELNKFLALFFIAISYAGQANACQTLKMADFIEEIKWKEGDFLIKETVDGFYIDPGLLILQDDGIHISYRDRDFLIPFMYHDTRGYFLSSEACYNLMNGYWMCCKCFYDNKMVDLACKKCKSKRCAKLEPGS